MAEMGEWEMWTRGFVLLFCGILLAGMGSIDRCSGQVTRSGSKLTSEVCSSSSPPFASTVADDFVWSGISGVVTLTIFGGPFGNSNTPASYSVGIWSDGGCVPMALLVAFSGQTPTVVFDHWDLDGHQIFEYTFTLNAGLVQGNLYWISVQADDHPIPDQWGVEMSPLVTGCSAMFESSHFGFPFWTDASLVPVPQDVHMEVTDGGPVPTHPSTWGSIKALYRN
jgi:hypothetical protein